jgi:hypothetical protein
MLICEDNQIRISATQADESNAWPLLPCPFCVVYVHTPDCFSLGALFACYPTQSFLRIHTPLTIFHRVPTMPPHPNTHTHTHTYEHTHIHPNTHMHAHTCTNTHACYPMQSLHTSEEVVNIDTVTSAEASLGAHYSIVVRMLLLPASVALTCMFESCCCWYTRICAYCVHT